MYVCVYIYIYIYTHTHIFSAERRTARLKFSVRQRVAMRSAGRRHWIRKGVLIVSIISINITIIIAIHLLLLLLLLILIAVTLYDGFTRLARD